MPKVFGLHCILHTQTPGTLCGLTFFTTMGSWVSPSIQSPLNTVPKPPTASFFPSRMSSCSKTQPYVCRISLGHCRKGPKPEPPAELIVVCSSFAETACWVPRRTFPNTFILVRCRGAAT